MTWTYDSTLTATKDQVRLLVGDTDVNEPLLQDEEIAFLLTENGTMRYAAVEAANAIAGLFARKADKEVGHLKLQASQKYKQYLALAVRLRRRAVVASVVPYAGGQTESDKDVNRDNTDIVPPFFTRETGEIPGTGLPGPSVDPLQVESR